MLAMHKLSKQKKLIRTSKGSTEEAPNTVLPRRNTFSLDSTSDASSPRNVADFVPTRRYESFQHVSPHMPSYNKLNQIRLKTVLDTESRWPTWPAKYVPDTRPNAIVMEKFNAEWEQASTPDSIADAVHAPPRDGSRGSSREASSERKYAWDATEHSVARRWEDFDAMWFKDPNKHFDMLKDLPSRVISSYVMKPPDAQKLLPPKQYDDLVQNAYEPLQHMKQIRWPLQYRIIGRLAGTYPAPRKNVFAVVEGGSKQFKVTPNDYIYVQKYRDVDINDVLLLQRVNLLGSRYETIIGRPYIPGAVVVAGVEEQTTDTELLFYRFRRNQRWSQSRLLKEHLTGLRIIDIVGIDEVPNHILESGEALYQPTPDLPLEEPEQPTDVFRRPRAALEGKKEKVTVAT